LSDPRLDLEPHEYRDKGRKLGWGDPRHKGLFWVYLVAAIAAVVWAYVVRDTVSTGTLVLFAAMAAFVGGIMFANIFDR
jgi:hypothetical protein